MSNESRKEYLALLLKRYQKSNRKEKGEILKEICRNLSVHKKTATRQMNPKQEKKRTPGRKRIYHDIAIYHLKELWKAMDYICSKKIVAAFPYWLPFYDCSEEIKKLLLDLSPSTIDRYLKPIRAQIKRRNRSGTKPGRMIKNLIPVKPLDWNVTEPGFAEGDTVAHCGDSLSGAFAWSLTFTDVLLGWTENRAVWNKLGDEVVNAIRDIEENLPFPLKGFACDNGSEFLTHKLIAYFVDPEVRKQIINFQRGRPYKKNDQCHVEQKNWTHVRQLLGYARIDNREALPLMNDLYKNDWGSYQNFFIPQMKLLRKTRVGARYKREYTEPKTPYQRLLECPSISQETKDKMEKRFKALNPFDLKQAIDKKLKRISRVMSMSKEIKTGS